MESKTATGWLVNPLRRERRDRSETLIDQHVLALIRKIDEIEDYSKDPEAGEILKLRDKALISMAWTFFKRGNEILNVKLQDVFYDDEELSVTFKISKKSKKIKICPRCRIENGKSAQFCRNCGENLQNVSYDRRKSEVIVVKRKSLEYPFCEHIVRWIQEAKRLGCPPEGFLFASMKNLNLTKKRILRWKKKITIQRFEQILQRLDPTLSTHMFRYGAAEKYLRLGYSTFELTQIGDWSSSFMPEVYARRKGLTPALSKFMKDTRTI